MMADDFVCGTPFETMAAEARWKRLVRAAIKDKGGNVNSIVLQRSFKGSLPGTWRSIGA